MRSHRCGVLRADHAGEPVRLAGWVHRRRNLGGLVFFDLRDRDGIVQVSFDPRWAPEEVMARAAEIGAETVVLVEGVVAERPEGARNPTMATGDVEVHGESFEVVGPAEPPAIPVWRTKGEDPPAEERRLEHRFLDLRRPEMQANLELRHRLLQTTRQALADQGFLEIETPILTKPTPEGARDYLVPSRVHPGQFYALPQSPQIYKQVLMSAGFDRYFQIARCFRDEDLRADRQPEFTQIDLEASFVDMNDVFGFVEVVAAALWREIGHEVELPLPRMRFADAMERFGSDRPDLRFGFEITDMAAVLGGRGFAAFDQTVGEGGRVRGIRVEGGGALSRKQLDRLTGIARSAGVGGLAYLKRSGDQLSGPLARLTGMTAELAGIADGDALLAAAGSFSDTSHALGAVRLELIGLLKPEPTRRHALTWVDGFPLFEADHEGGYTFAHHPFTAPVPDDVERVMRGEIGGGITAQHYDLVYNGHELGSGSIRIGDPALQLKVLGLLGIDAEQAERRFGFLLRALRGGAPPHGGIALGFDRIAMLLAGADNLRDVIAFPKTTAARALFEDSPTSLADDDLAGLGLRVDR